MAKIFRVIIKEGTHFIEDGRVSTYTYSCDEKGFVVKNTLNSDFKFTVHGNYIGKQVVFKLDMDPKRPFRFLGIAKKPDDPLKELIWKYGFTRPYKADSLKKLLNSIYLYALNPATTEILVAYSNTSKFNVRIIPAYILKYVLDDNLETARELLFSNEYHLCTDLSLSFKNEKIYLALSAYKHGWYYSGEQFEPEQLTDIEMSLMGMKGLMER